jgi:hypothetical protein
MAIATPPSPSTSTSPTPQPDVPWTPPPARPRRRGLVGGLVLIALGILFLIQQVAAPGRGWDVLWPVLLIVIGVAVGASPFVYGQRFTTREVSGPRRLSPSACSSSSATSAELADRLSSLD